MAVSSAALIASAAIGGAAALGGSLINGFSTHSTNSSNIKSQERMNASNIAAQKEINAANIASQERINQLNLDYARSMTQAQWERDDNAHQREVADLQAAGLSPLASVAGSTNSAVVSHDSIAPYADPLPEQRAYMAQAPQFDINSLMQSILQTQKLQEQYREHSEKMIREDRSLDLTSQNIALKAQSLDIESSKVDAELLKVANNYQIASDNIALQKMEIKNAKDKADKEIALQTMAHNSQRLFEAQKKALDAGHLETIPYYDLDKYEKALKQWGNEFDAYLSSHHIRKTGSWQASVDGKLSNKFNFGGFGLSYGNSKNDFYERAQLQRFYARCPYPIFVY